MRSHLRISLLLLAVTMAFSESYHVFATRSDAEIQLAGANSINALPVPWVDAVDISNAVLYLASDEARYVTGTTHVIDAGALAPYKIPHV